MPNFSWEFFREFWLHIVLGMIAIVPITSLTAALGRTTHREARGTVRAFLRDWSATTPRVVWGVVRWLRVSGSVFLLALFAWAFNRLGDASLPWLSGLFGHFGEERVAWEVNYSQEYDTLRYSYRVVTGIGSDDARWEREKVRLGSYTYTIFRTTFWLAVAIVAAGFITLVSGRRAHRRRGLGEILGGVVAALVSIRLWAAAEDTFIQRVEARYRNRVWEATRQEPLLPGHYPGARASAGTPVPPH